MANNITEVWDTFAKEHDFPSMNEFTRHMKAVRDIGAWALTTFHTEAAKEVKAILFKHFPEILGD